MFRIIFFFFFSSRRRHTRSLCDWSSDVCSSDLALPLDSRTREQFEWLADEVLEAKGEATIWIAESASAAQERALAARMADAIAGEYAALVEAAAEDSNESPAERRRRLRRLRR